MDLHLLPCGRRLVVARSRRDRLLGLLPLDALPARDGLLLPHCRSVHTIGMRFAIDLVWLGGDGRVLGVDEGVGPFRQRASRRAAGVLETAAGCGAGWASALGGGACALDVAAILGDVDCHDCSRASGLTRLTLS